MANKILANGYVRRNRSEGIVEKNPLMKRGIATVEKANEIITEYKILS